MKKTTPILRAAAALLCLCMLLCGLAACTEMTSLVSGVEEGQFPVEIDGVTVSAKPQRVLVLSPSLADVVLALGCDTQLAASSENCTQDRLRDLPKLSDFTANGISAAGISPDLVLVDPSSGVDAQLLRDAGMTVLEISPARDRQDFERLYSQVSSALLGNGSGYDAGIETAQNIFITLDEINRVASSDKVTVACYLYDLEGSGITGDMFGTTIMTYSGVTNAFKDQTGGQYQFDSLTLSNPYVIFCRPGLKEEIEADSRFQNLQAVEHGRIFELDPRYMEWQGRTVVSAALEISGSTFPELLQENSVNGTDPTLKIEDSVNSQLQSSALEADDTVYPILQEGDQGEDVLAVQSKLDELGYLDTEYDGHYGEYTAGCVREFQAENGLPETGIADSDTQKLLFSSNAKAKGGASAEPSATPEASGSPEASVEPDASAAP